MKNILSGLKAWLPENGPQTDEEWFILEVWWCKTYLVKNHRIPKDYFSLGVIEQAKKELGLE
jgi:hypothetical protein